MPSGTPASRHTLVQSLLLGPDVRLAKVMNDGLVGVFYDGDFALWTRVKLRKANDCVISGWAMKPGEWAFSPIGNQQYRARRISAEVMDQNIEVWRRENEVANDDEKKVLALDGYEIENLQPINPGDAIFQPGERVLVTEEYDEVFEGDEGVVQAVGYAGGFYNCIVVDLLREGYEETDRVPQEILEGA